MLFFLLSKHRAKRNPCKACIWGLYKDFYHHNCKTQIKSYHAAGLCQALWFVFLHFVIVTVLTHQSVHSPV